MNCVNCYQEIPDGSKFCPHCGAQQPETTGTDPVNTQPDTAGQPGAEAQTGTTETSSQPGAQTVGAQYQNQYQSDPYQNGQYQNASYQTPPVYQSTYEPAPQVNWVPYLVLSIISTVCCCVPFGIVAIVYAAKINSSVSAGNIEEAQRAAKTSKIWIIAAFASGFIVLVLYLLFFLVIGDTGYYYY